MTVMFLWSLKIRSRPQRLMCCSTNELKLKLQWVWEVFRVLILQRVEGSEVLHFGSAIQLQRVCFPALSCRLCHYHSNGGNGFDCTSDKPTIRNGWEAHTKGWLLLSFLWGEYSSHMGAPNLVAVLFFSPFLWDFLLILFIVLLGHHKYELVVISASVLFFILSFCFGCRSSHWFFSPLWS